MPTINMQQANNKIFKRFEQKLTSETRPWNLKLFQWPTGYTALPKQSNGFG